MNFDKDMMSKQTRQVSQEQIAHQWDCINQIQHLLSVRADAPHFYCQTFGCQQNEADTERIAGMLR